MDKRQFLKTSGALVAGGMFSQLISGEAKAGDAEDASHRTNWSGNYTYSTDHLHRPKNVEELCQVIKDCSHLRALGTRHSFNSIADSTANQISLEHLAQMDLDEKAHTVTVGAGVRYGQLAPYIDSKGFALHNLASLPHISVAGACATATHGSGLKNGNLSTAVSGLELVNAKGEVTTLSRGRDGARFEGAVVSLGATGVVTKVTLNVQPTFQVSQIVYENLSFSQLEHHRDEIFGAGYSVSLFTDWQNHQATQVWIKSRLSGSASLPAKPTFFGAKLATRKLHPLAGHSAENCTEQLGIAGPWYERLPHFRMNFTPSSGAELQSEFFVPYEKGLDAILAVERLRDHITPHLFITELRTIDADDLWMSPAYKRRSLAIHFTWKPEWPAVKNVLPRIEEALEPFDARPHWAKLFTMAPARIQSRYTKLADYRKLIEGFDPERKFRNEFLQINLYS